MVPSHVRRAVAAGVLAVALAGVRADGEDGGAAPSVELVARLRSADPAERAAAADALTRAGAAAVPALADALADPATRVAAADVLARIGPDASDAVTALTKLCRGAWSSERASVIAALGAIGEGAAPSAEALGRIVLQKSAKDRLDAVTALERIIGPAGRRTLHEPRPGTAQRLIDAGCDWLVRHQSGDGRWGCATFEQRCAAGDRCGGAGHAGHDAGVTGLATLALLGAGGAAPPERRGAVDGALAFLMSAQREDGAIATPAQDDAAPVSTGESSDAYDHACAALALVDAYARTRDVAFRDSAQRAVRHVRERQNPYLAWRYGVRDGDNDTSVTAWMVQVLARAAEVGPGLAGDDGWRNGAHAWIEKMTEAETGRVGYRQRGSPPARTARNGRFPSEASEATTASGLLVRLLCRSRADDADSVAKALDVMRWRPPAWDAARGSTDLVYWFHGAAALRRAPGPPSTADGWFSALVAALKGAAEGPERGCARGSWPAEDAWSHVGGRVYATATAVLALEQCEVAPAERVPLPAWLRVAADALGTVATEPAPLGPAADDVLRMTRIYFKR